MARAICLTLTLVLAVSGLQSNVAAQEVDSGFSPTSGHARVIAQGVVPLPAGEAVWRTVRTLAPLPADAPFEARPLGFVLATAGPLLLVDQDSGEQVRLGAGEAALVREGTVQQRASLGARPVSYLSIELVPVDAPPPPDDATVLQPGQPFPAPSGLRDLDLLSDTLAGNETFTVPDSGAKNVILITDGTASVGRPDGEPVVLLAGEAASFSGELRVVTAPDGQSDPVSFVVAIIGPEVPPPAVPAETAVPSAGEPASSPAAETPATAGSIAVQVYTCPPGMDAESLDPVACDPATGDFDVTLSGAALSAPLTLVDATGSGETFVWAGLPFGDYVIAEAVLPSGYASYLLAARNAAGNPESGYRVTLAETEPDLAVRIYNFAPS